MSNDRGNPGHCYCSHDERSQRGQSKRILLPEWPLRNRQRTSHRLNPSLMSRNWDRQCVSNYFDSLHMRPDRRFHSEQLVSKLRR